MSCPGDDRSGDGCCRAGPSPNQGDIFMLKKLLVFAITSGLAAKLYKAYVNKQGSDNPTATGTDNPVSRKRPATKPS
jgi:hypothetical protein